MKKIYAKSENDVLLVDHSRNVYETSKILTNKLPKLSGDKERMEIIRISCLLHDIGKSTAEFQKNLKKDTEGQSKNKFRHNEIGWAFCYRYLNLPTNVLNPVLYQIYWHHGISNELRKNTIDDILKTINESDVETMKCVVTELLGEEYLLSEERTIRTFTPLFYNELDNDNSLGNMSEPLLMMIKNILIISDHLQSAYETKSILSIEDEINKYIYKPTIYNTEKCPKDYQIKRHLRNIQISNDAGKTTIINGPGGLGKTDIGVHWSTNSDKRFMIVGPTNIITKSIYENINKINLNYELNLTTQLYLTGEVVDSNTGNEKPFSSHINITNIDNFLKPQVDDKSDNHVGRLIMMLFSDIQFDEYHELLGENAMFRLFIIIMRMRDWYTDTRTLLTSATPIPIENLWQTANKTTILPEKNKHYPSSHNKKYKIKVLKHNPTTEDIHSNNTLVIFNSITEAQLNKNTLGIDKLIHSGYQKEDRKKHFEFLYDQYGKQTSRSYDKPNVIGTSVLQTSIDMSFNHLVESVCSPQTTLQRIPRVNRWGDITTTPTITFFNMVSKSEDAMKRIFYTYNLSELWFKEIEKLDGYEMTLDELNNVYNNFQKNNETQLKNYIDNLYQQSTISLSNLYPIRFNKSKNKSKIIKAGGNKLRTSINDKEIMVIVKIYDTDQYTDATPHRYYDSIDNDFNERGNIFTPIINVYKELTENCDDRFDFHDIIKKKNRLTISDLRKFGRYSNTPYVRFDQVYHPEYGFINKNTLENILKK